MGRVFNDYETALCPVDGCPQPHADLVAKILNTPIAKIKISMDAIRIGGPGGALNDAITAGITERARAAEAVLRRHAESHDVLDYLRTIHRLNCELDGRRAGIRPHMTRPDGPHPDQFRIGPAGGNPLPPELT